MTAVTEKLLTYALGRGLGYADAPTVREIKREAAASNYKFGSLVLGIVKSTPFQMSGAIAGRIQAVACIAGCDAKCLASFFLELKMRHCTVPIGVPRAAAISWYSHCSTKRKIITSRSPGSRNAIQSRNSKAGVPAGFWTEAAKRLSTSARFVVSTSRLTLP